jgi:hypothetical protein
MAKKPAEARRKLVEFDAETWQALDVLARDSMKTFQELADEAFRDLLRKYGRPTDLTLALSRSLRAFFRSFACRVQSSRAARLRGDERIVRLRARRRGEEAAPAAVRPPAAPELAIGRWLRFAEWDRFVLDRAHACKRALNDDVAFARHDHPLLWHDEAVAGAATPFAGGVAMAAAGNPTVMS